MSWFILLLAGVFEIAWAIGLKYTEGFTRLWPTLGTVAAMGVSITLLGLAMKSLPLGTAYAIWVGIVCLHVRHGVWSALATLGGNTSPGARSFLNGLAWVIAVVLFVGFMIMPLAVLFGWVN